MEMLPRDGQTYAVSDAVSKPEEEAIIYVGSPDLGSAKIQRGKRSKDKA